MPAFIIPIIYTILFGLIIFKSKTLAKGLNKKWMTLAFFLKVIAGCTNLAIWMFIIGRGDSLNYLHDAELIYGTLFENPSHFFQLTFGWGPDNVYPEHLRYISDPLKYSWNNIEYSMVRLNTILYVFTFGNPWANIVILDFIYFLGSVWLYKLLIARAAHLRKAFFVLLFCFPSLLLWSSGLLKEGPALLFIQLIIGTFLLIEDQKSFKSIWILLLALAGLLVVRDYFALILIMLMPLWWISYKFEIKGWKVFGIAAIFGMISIVLVDYYSYAFTVSEIICEAQQFFIIYGSDPDYNFYIFSGYELLEPIQQFPYALNNIFFRPNLLHSSDMFRIYISVELMVTWFLIGLVVYKQRNKRFPPFFWLLLSFSSITLLLYGYVVTDADTLSRYRSIPVFVMLLISIYPKKMPNQTI